MRRGTRAVALASALLLLQALASHARQLVELQQVEGDAQVLIADSWGAAPQRQLVVRTAAGRPVFVKAPAGGLPAGLRTGARVTVTGAWLGAAGGAAPAPRAAADAAEAAGAPRNTGSFAATAITVTATPPTGEARHSIAPAQLAGGAAADAAADAAAAAAAALPLSSNELLTAELSTLIIPIVAKTPSGGACPGTQLPNFTADQVRRAVFEEQNAGGVTVGGTFNRCSHGKTRLTAANSAVVEPVELPCSGTRDTIYWSFSSCEGSDMWYWAVEALDALAARGVNTSAYQYKVFLTPPGPPCYFVGLGFQGCGSWDCMVWLTGDWWTTPMPFVHEMGHNLFMGHSGRPDPINATKFNDYGDRTCALGELGPTRCYNTPHAWQQGWVSLQQLDGSSLGRGQTVTTVLASQSAHDEGAGLRILPGWAPAVDPIFVGYRTREGGDAELAEDLASRVHVYSTAISGTRDDKPTAWLASLAAGDRWEHPGAGVVVRVRSAGPDAASVSICRKGGHRETAASCAAGLDWNCDGRAGQNDPACAQLLVQTVVTPPPSKRVQRPPRLARRTAPPLLRRMAAA